MTDSHQAEATEQKAADAPHEDSAGKISSPAQVTGAGWKFTAKNAWRQFGKDQCTDLAAGMTYYSVLALFPGLMALVSVLALVGQSAGGTQALLDVVKQLAPGDAYNQLKGPITQMVNSRGTGLALVVGLLSALWSASGYVGAFGRAMNRIYEVAEGRPVWKLRPVNLAVTLFATVVAALMLVGLVVSGPIAESIGNVIGLGSTALTVWTWVKYPVMLLLAVMVIAVLYHFTPNVRQPKFKWLSVGAVVALVTAVLASLGFALYVTYAGNYSKTYGTLAGVIVMLLWIWIVNLALLFGAEVDSELERTRQLESGIKAEKELQLPPKDASGIEKAQKKEDKAEQEARDVRISATRRPAPEDQARAAELRKESGFDEDGFVEQE